MKKGKALMRRIGMLTSGGDCQSLNATMRGVAKSLYKMFDDIEIVGFEDGYKGLMYADYRIMKQSDFSGILTRGGTILGTSRQPFKLMRMPDENGLDKVEAMGIGPCWGQRSGSWKTHVPAASAPAAPCRPRRQGRRA